MKYPLCGCKPTAYSGSSQTAVHTCEGQRDQVLTKDEWTEFLHVTNAIAHAKASHPSNPQRPQWAEPDQLIGDDGGEL
jgi:hypothetical protein